MPGAIKGARERKRAAEKAKNTAASFSFRAGMQTLTDALARAMIKLANEPAVLTAVGAAALADVRARFAVEAYNDRLYGLYGIAS